MAILLFCCSTINYSMPTNLQVAFGSDHADFTRELKGQENCLKQLKGNSSLIYLVDSSFKGLDMTLRFPAYKV